MAGDFSVFIQKTIGAFPNIPRDISLFLQKGVEEYRKAFTVPEYQVLEQIGDAVISHFIISYSYKKFPFLNCKEGVKVVARVRINYTSCQFLAEIARDLGFWEHISGKDEAPIQGARKLNLLEDVFEAFVGATYNLIDEEFGQGTGFIVCNQMLAHIYDARRISLLYDDLFDSKTRLKELCDFFKKNLSVSWSFEKDEFSHLVRLDVKVDGKTFRFKASARVKIDAEQQVSQEAIDALRREGISKEEPEFFRFIRAKLRA
jgi:dsRNA-specific ribonuclease